MKIDQFMDMIAYLTRNGTQWTQWSNMLGGPAYIRTDTCLTMCPIVAVHDFLRKKGLRNQPHRGTMPNVRYMDAGFDIGLSYDQSKLIGDAADLATSTYRYELKRACNLLDNC